MLRQQRNKITLFKLELLKQIIRSDPTQSIMGWWFSESIQPSSLFSEQTKFEPGL